MYGIYAYIDPSNHPNVDIYGIHGASGIPLGEGLMKSTVGNQRLALRRLWVESIGAMRVGEFR